MKLDKDTMIACEWMKYVRGGSEVAETLYSVGRFSVFADLAGIKLHLVPRDVVVNHILGQGWRKLMRGPKYPKSTDSKIRVQLLSRFGCSSPPKKGEHLHGITGHEWQALAVAMYLWDDYRRDLPCGLRY